MEEEEQILAELSTLDDLLLPLSRSARLKYNCMSVSEKFVALGSNTGGIYLFSRETCKLLQVVFAEKETSPVVMVMLSPSEKFVAMVVSTGSLHVIDLKMESRAKPDTLRSTSDFWNGTVTCLHWDYTSTRLYIGDSLGKVYLMPVHSSKAKNLFSLPLETIMRLDSSIVQIDKASDKLLVSTLSRCYLCDTNRQQYSQVGKKTRDGEFGACFLHQGSSTPTIYCARPGSRIWEVDFDGNVMNTHQFKQLLAVPPLPVVRIKEALELPTKDNKHGAQSLSFPRLKVIGGSYILTWTASSICVLDPVNVKVVLWSQPFSEIQEVCCVKNDLFIFLPSMQVHCLSLLPVSRVTSLCLKSEAFTNAANLCVFFENSYVHKRKAGYFGLTEMRSLYDCLVTSELLDLAENLHLTIVNVEKKLAALSESGSSGSGKSRTNSFVDKDASEKIHNHKIEKVTSSGSDITYKKNQNENEPIKSILVKTEVALNEAEEIKSQKDFSMEIKDTVAIETGISAVTEKVKEIYPSEDTEIKMLNTVETENDRDSTNRITGDLESENGETAIDKKFSYRSDDKVTNSLAICEQIDEKDNQNIGDIDTSCDKNIDGQINLSLLSKAQNTELGGFIDASTPNMILCHLESATKDTKEEILVNGPSDLKADNKILVNQGDKSDQNDINKIVNLTGVLDGYHDISQVNEVHVHEENVEGGMKPEFELNQVKEETVLEQTKGEFGVETVDSMYPASIQSENRASLSVETVKITKEFPNRSSSPALVSASLKSDEADDIIEDDLELQSRSSNMGSRRTSLTSLSSLSSAEVYVEQVAGTQDEIAIPVKKKSSRRRQRKSVDSAGDPIRKGDVGPSPQGSLDQTVEEDCFTATNSDSVKIDQQTVSKSVPATPVVEGHARSLPNARSFENSVQDISELPVLIIPDNDSNKESVLSHSAEFSKSGEFGMSGDYSPSESPLTHSYEETRSGGSGSRKTAFLHLKDRVQRNLKSQTKRVITNIKDKNLLTRAKVFLSQPIDHQKSEFYIQAHHGFESHDIGHEDHILDETDSTPESPVDISALQNITAETQEKLRDPYVLLNPDLVYKILLEWVTVLNRTFYNLHLIKYAQSSVSHLGAGADKVTSDSDQNVIEKISVNQSDIVGSEASERKPDGSEIVEPNVDKTVMSDSAERKEMETLKLDTVQNISTEKGDALHITDSVKEDVPGASILYDKDFCYTKDPLFLPTDIDGDVSELAQACFDMNCHGNILKYKNLPRFDSKKDGIETLLNDCDQLKESQEVEVKSVHEVEKHSTETVCNSESEASLDELDLKNSSSDNFPKQVCDIHSENVNSLQTLQISSSYSLDNHNGSDKMMSDTDSCDTLTSAKTKLVQDLSSDIVLKPSVEAVGGIEDLDTCNYADDKVNDDDNKVNDDEMAFFVRCYFPYLSAIKIRNKAKEYGKNLYHTWCALVCCLQELACEDRERYGVDNDALLQHMIESLSPYEDGFALLGHISRLFSFKPSNLVSACVRCHPFIQPVDVLFMCSLHGVALETTFKSYMQQMIQDATRTHRKDTISSLYAHHEVKKEWLNILLSDEGNVQEMIDSNGKPRSNSHTHIWKNQPAIEDIVKKTETREDKHMVLELCSKYGYWNGCLRLLKDLNEEKKQTDLIFHLDDVKLFSAKDPPGYLPKSTEDWRQLLQVYKNHANKITTNSAGSQLETMSVSDCSDRITWNSLALLLIRHLGPSQAVSLLQEMDVPESSLSASFHQTCALAGLVHKHQRLVLHSMLEKIDTYLWAQRPVYSSPQLHYIVLKEKELQDKGSNSVQQEHLQRLIQQVRSDRDDTKYVEEPDCHWGVETKINLMCPCCNIPLKETVSHVEPGIFLFKCGHGYHRMCLPERDCFLCAYENSSMQESSFV